MSDKAKIKKEVTIVLRALLLSAPLGLTATEIERDFKEAQGYGVPYRELGYNCTSDLVEDLGDVASCSWERGHAVFRGIADKTTRHIQSLVSKQNVDVRKCLKRRNAIEKQVSRAGHGGNSGRSYSYSSSGRQVTRPSGPYSRSTGGQSGNWKRPNSYPGTGSSRPSSKPATVQTTSPAYLRTQLKTLLTAHPNGILNSHFDSIFMRKFGFRVDYAKLGFSGLVDLVKSLQSVISVEHLGDDRFRIYSTENFPKGSVTPTSSSNTAAKSSTSSSRTSDSVKPLSETYSSKAKSKPSGSQIVIPRFIPDATKSVPFKSPPKASGGSTPASTSSRGRARRHMLSRSSEASSKSGSSVSTTSPREPSPPGNELIDKQLCDEIQTILVDHRNGLFAANLPAEYKALTRKELPLISIGFYSVVELVSAIPEIVAIERQKKNSDWKLFDARTFVPTKPQEPERKKKPIPTASQSGEDALLEDAKTKIRDLLLAHPTGVLLQDLPGAYERVYKKPLPCQDFGVNDINSLVLAIPDTIKVVYKGQSKVYLHAQDQGLPSAGLSYSSVTKSIPQDAIGYGFSYHPAVRPKLEEYFPIYISTVYTPHKMSIQLKDKEGNLALESLMDKLEAVYSFPEGEKYLMPDAMIAVNQICCALYHEDNNWHRGLITGVPNMDLVEVLYVDYGTSVSVPKCSLRLLKSCFMKLPVQAIDARLAGIEPVGEKWSKESKNKLLQLSFNKALLAYGVEENKSVVSLLLCDTATAEDVHINDLLVSEGLAKFTDQEEGEQVEEKPTPPTNAIPSASELTMQMLTGIGLPVPEDDPAQDFQWPDESAEVQQIMGTGPEGDDGRVHGAPQGPTSGSEVNGGGDATQIQPDQVADTNEELVDEMARELSEIEEESEGSQKVPWTVRSIELITGQTLHPISFGGAGQYVTSVEIVHLIWSREQDENALFELIEQKAAQLGQVIVEELENEDLAESLGKQGVLLSPTNPSKLQLFQLSSVSSLVHVSGLANPELVLELQAIADEMPSLEDDDFSHESVSTETSGSAETDVGLTEMRKMHEVLKTRRERILKDLMENTGLGNVDDLMHIERVMRDIKEQLEQGKAKQVPSASVDEMSSQLSQTTLDSSIPLTPTTPNDVFSPPPAVPLPEELFTRDNQSQTIGYSARHLSEKLGMGQKQTATISPLQRHSSAPPPSQMGIGRGARVQKRPMGMGRGQPVKPLDLGMKAQYQQNLGLSLNPDTPAFIPSPKRDGQSDLAPGMIPFGNSFANPPPMPPNMPPNMPPMAGGGRGLNMLPPSFSDFPMLPPGMPPMPPMPNRTATLHMPPMGAIPPPNLLRPGGPNFMPQIGIPPPSFPSQGNMNPTPGVPPPTRRFDLLPPGQMFDPSLPPPMHGMGRGHQQWSVNE